MTFMIRPVILIPSTESTRSYAGTRSNWWHTRISERSWGLICGIANLDACCIPTEYFVTFVNELPIDYKWISGCLTLPMFNPS